MKSTLERVQREIAQQLGCAETDAKPEATFVELGVDSLDTIELVMALEDEFGIEIADDRWEPVKTVQQALDVVQQAQELAA